MLFGGPPDIEKLKASKNVGGLVKAMANRDQAIASKAAAALAELGDPAAIDPLSAVIDKEGGPQLAAIQALTAFAADPRTFRPILNGAWLSKNPEVRRFATDYLIKEGKAEAVRDEMAKRFDNVQKHLMVTPPLVAQLGFDIIGLTMSGLKSEADLRTGAAALLSALGGSGKDPLMPVIQTCAREAQRRAAHELVKVVDRNTAARLDASLNDPSPDVRYFASIVHIELESPLVAKLITNEEAKFLEGLREAVAISESGKPDGIKAMREAIRIKSDKPEVTFYESGVVSTVGLDRYTEARPKILALATRRALLEDPYQSGDLVSAVVFGRSPEELETLVREIFTVGGADQGFSFQLIYNELRSTARVKLGLKDTAG